MDGTDTSNNTMWFVSKDNYYILRDTNNDAVSLFKGPDELPPATYSLYALKVLGKNKIPGFFKWEKISSTQYETFEIMSGLPKAEIVPLTIKKPINWLGSLLSRHNHETFVVLLMICHLLFTLAPVMYFIDKFSLHTGLLFIAGASIVSSGICFAITLLLERVFKKNNWINAKLV